MSYSRKTGFITRLISIVLLSFFVPVTLGSSAAALDDNQKKLYQNSIQYFNYRVDNSNASSGCDTANQTIAGTSNIESDNAKTAYDFFVSKGLEPFRAAAIIGNLQIESGLNPRIRQGGGGPGRGIAQWSVNERWVELQKWANGQDIYNINIQLGFVWYEMTEVAPWKDTYPKIQAATNIDTATDVFMRVYERAGATSSITARQSAAKAVLKIYGNGAPTSGSAIPVAGQPASTADGPSGAACGGSFTGNPDQTKKLNKGFTLNDNTDYSATPCAAGSTEVEIYVHPTAHFKIRVCMIDGTSIPVASIVSERVVAMIKDAKAAGVKLDGSGFRKYENQAKLYAQNCNRNGVCSPPTAPPGRSQHERGLAIDFGVGDRNSAQYKWLASNAAKYGFYNLPSEAWHWSTSGS